MTRRWILACALALMPLAGAGCGDDDETTTPRPDAGADADGGGGDAEQDTPLTDTGVDTDAAVTDTPPDTPLDTPVDTPLDTPPDTTDTGPVFVQVERMGRPGVATALITDKEAYNAAGIADWADFIPDMVFHIVGDEETDGTDDLDGEEGDFLTAVLPETSPVPGDPAGGLLAAVLSDDRLRVDTGAAGPCALYLAAELRAVTALPAGVGGCGGRGLTVDVMDFTVAAVVGELDDPTTAGTDEGFHDGVDPPVAADVDIADLYPLSVFPFVGTPHTGQLDRMGRPGVNTALIGPDGKIGYNRAGLADWSDFIPDMAAHVLGADALDGEAGDFLTAVLPETSPVPGDPTGGLLAAVLSDDRIRVDTSDAVSANCDTYLAAELRAVTVLPAGVGGCGGRGLEVDVMDATVGGVVGENGFTDGVDGNECAFLDAFPFLAAPDCVPD